eukprot:12221775-Alexandrium_andersonii.AAC.1
MDRACGYTPCAVRNPAPVQIENCVGDWLHTRDHCVRYASRQPEHWHVRTNCQLAAIKLNIVLVVLSA